MTIKCICVDDEPLARKGIKLAIAPFNDFEMVAEFGAVDELLNDIPTDIDVLFVDIEMPRQNGFALLENWPGQLPIVVFVTAYDQYAVKAFEQQALDYLLKPIDEERFAKVIERIRARIEEQNEADNSDKLKQTIEGLKQKLYTRESAISVKTDEGYFRIKLTDLLYVEAVGNHVCLHLKDKQLITRDTLKNYISQLAEHDFHQVHKSLLVNSAHVIQVSKLRFGDHQLLMSNDAELRLSRRYKSVISAFCP